MELRDSKLFNLYLKYSTKVLQATFGVKKQKEFYEFLFWRYTKFRERSLNNQHYEPFFTTFFGLQKENYKGKRVLDIGCGPRGSLEWADNTLERVGLDTLADKYVKLEGKKHLMKYVQGVAEDIPFPDDHFDFVTSLNSLDHVDDLEQSIKEIKRVLKPGGIFLLISDIHTYPTVCEPSVFGWEITQAFKPEFEILVEKHFEGNLMYKSLREGVPYDHENKKERYGILTAKFRKA